MKRLAFVVAAASLFAIAPMAHRVGPVGSAVVFIWLGVLVAVCASGVVSSLAVTGGALGAFGAGVLAPISPAAAGALLIAAAFAERTTRVRSRTARAVHVLVALVGGALAGSLAAAFTTSTIPVMIVAIIVSAVLSSLPMLVEADDPVAHALDIAANEVSEPAKTALHSGAELRRQAEHVPLDRGARERVKKTWQALLRLAEARTRLERNRPKIRVAAAGVDGMAPLSAKDAVLGMVDQRIDEHVTALGKALAAVDTAHAAAVGIDDADLRSIDTMGDSLEDVSNAMVEVRTSADS